jgi:AcrR family transcriptional regulator
LDAAKVVFRAKGYHPVSIGDIIEHANIARGTFYLYFTNKEDIFRALLDEFLGAIRGQVRRISTAPDAAPPVTQLRANFRRILNAVIAYEDVADIMLRDPAGFDAQSRSELDQFSVSVLQMAEDALRVGQSLGLIRSCDVHLTAVATLGGVQQTLRRMLQVRSLGGNSPLAGHEHVANELIAFILAAVGSPRLTRSMRVDETGDP